LCTRLNVQLSLIREAPHTQSSSAEPLCRAGVALEQRVELLVSNLAVGANKSVERDRCGEVT
jgi:hypothetical protein